jgi:putative transposase
MGRIVAFPEGGGLHHRYERVVLNKRYNLNERENLALVVRMAEENRGLGYTRIQGALPNLGHTIGRTTVADILKRHGLEPAPERTRKTTWKEFLHRLWHQIVAADFGTVELWTQGIDAFRVFTRK